jgi:hypothetical protein
MIEPSHIPQTEVIMNDYTIFWLDGTTTAVSGESYTDALNRGGIGAGALGSIDFIGTGSNVAEDWVWDADARTWVKA